MKEASRLHGIITFISLGFEGKIDQLCVACLTDIRAYHEVF